MEHLTVETAKWLDKSNEERIAAIRKEKWVGHTQAKRILTRLAELHHYPPVDPDANNLLLIGEPGSGKTGLMRYYAKAYQPSIQEYKLHWPIVFIQLVDGPKEQFLYEAILQALQATYAPRASISDKRRQVLHLLKFNQVKLLFIDEVHQMLLGSALQQRSFLAGLKSLCNEASVPLVCAGVESAHNAMCLDEQVGRRFEIARLPQWTMNQEFVNLLKSFELLLALKKPSHLTEPALAFKLLELSRGSIGRLSRILKLAAIHAVQSEEERITLQGLQSMHVFPLADES